MIEPGHLDRMVTIRERNAADAVGDSGFPTETFATLEHVFMKVEQASGRELYRAEQLSTRVEMVFTMHYRDDMDPIRSTVDVAKHRQLVLEGWVYDITNVEMIGRNEGLKLFGIRNGRA